MTDREREREALYALGQLRHAYPQLLGGEIRDQAELARGLLGPAIEKLERYLSAPSAAEEPPPTRCGTPSCTRGSVCGDTKCTGRGLRAKGWEAEHVVIASLLLKRLHNEYGTTMSLAETPSACELVRREFSRIATSAADEAYERAARKLESMAETHECEDPEDHAGCYYPNDEDTCSVGAREIRALKEGGK